MTRDQVVIHVAVLALIAVLIGVRLFGAILEEWWYRSTRDEDDD